MNREFDSRTQDPLELLPLGRMEVRQMRAREEWGNIKRAREAATMHEGPDRERTLAQIRLSLKDGEPVEFGSVGRGSGERHTRQSNLGSETIL